MTTTTRTWSQAQSVAAARMFLRALPVLPPPRTVRENVEAADEEESRWRRTTTKNNNNKKKKKMTGLWGSSISSGDASSTITSPESEDEVLAFLFFVLFFGLMHVTNKSASKEAAQMWCFFAFV